MYMRPLAHRMGLYNIKTEMEDLAMKYMEPDTYRYIAQKLQDTKRERTRYINDFIRPLKEKLDKTGILILRFMAGQKAFTPSGIK